MQVLDALAYRLIENDRVLENVSAMYKAVPYRVDFQAVGADKIEHQVSGGAVIRDVDFFADRLQAQVVLNKCRLTAFYAHPMGFTLAGGFQVARRVERVYFVI
jgi:hypothetical protein